MKKTVLALAALTMLASVFTSCKKDTEGAFNPKQKIEGIYTEETVTENGNQVSKTDKYLSEKWNWGGKTLTSIDFMNENGSVAATEKYTYDDKNRIATLTSGSQVGTFTYDGKEMTKFEVTENGQFAMSLQFEHDGKKIVKIILTTPVDDDDFDFDFANSRIVRQVLGNELTKAVNFAHRNGRMVARKNAVKASTESITMLISWDGDNVSNVSGSLSFMGMSLSMNIDFTYDNQLNPLYGNMAIFTLGASEGNMGTLSKNNVTSMTTKMTMPFFGEQKDVINYKYTYDGKYPSAVTMEEKVPSYTMDEDGNLVEDGAEITITTNYYQYVK